jgi:hypothetical protein
LRKNRTLPIIDLDRHASVVVQFRPRPSGSPALMHGISSGGVVRSLSAAASKQKSIIRAFRDRIPIAGPHRREAKNSGSRGRLIKNSALKHADRPLPINQNDTGGIDPTRSSRTADIAFQHAMQRAIARGLEHPPMIGRVKDTRPLNASRLFDPVPHSSGCTSPALECAELSACNDSPAAPKARPR